jgi:hypothetical protein
VQTVIKECVVPHGCAMRDSNVFNNGSQDLVNKLQNQKALQMRKTGKHISHSKTANRKNETLKATAHLQRA